MAFLTAAGAADQARAAARISEIRTDTRNLVVMENEFVRMTVDLRRGARVTEFLYKPLNRQWVGVGQGMFADHITQQSWPGELYDATYEHEITARGPDRVAVKVWRNLEAKENVNLSGLKVERTMILTDGSPVVEAEIAVINPTAAVKTMSYWSQSLFRLGDKFFQNGFFTGSWGFDVIIRERVSGAVEHP